MRLSALPAVLAALFGLAATAAAEDKKTATLGKIVRLDPAFDDLIAPDAVIEKLADGYDWAEGPAWNKAGKYLLFSDIPKNTVWKYQDGKVSLYLKPSGYSGQEPFTGKEPGSNGLAFDAEGRLILCQHGDRRVVRQEKDGKLTVLADKYQGKRLNSPNDLDITSKGDIYFTDPPYGLPKLTEDPNKELDYQGVYRLTADGTLTLLTKELTRPNGIAFAPDEKSVYIANSDPKAAIWKVYPVNADGTLGAGKLFADMTERVGKEPGLPDGLKVDVKGNVFATGPGGVHVFSPQGKLLGTLATGVPTANCGWGDDGTVLYITADKALCRVKTKTKGFRY